MPLGVRTLNSVHILCLKAAPAMVTFPSDLPALFEITWKAGAGRHPALSLLVAYHRLSGLY
jgi:hypothetical protein